MLLKLVAAGIMLVGAPQSAAAEVILPVQCPGIEVTRIAASNEVGWALDQLRHFGFVADKRDWPDVRVLAVGPVLDVTWVDKPDIEIACGQDPRFRGKPTIRVIVTNVRQPLSQQSALGNFRTRTRISMDVVVSGPEAQVQIDWKLRKSREEGEDGAAIRALGKQEFPKLVLVPLWPNVN